MNVIIDTDEAAPPGYFKVQTTAALCADKWYHRSSGDQVFRQYDSNVYKGGPFGRGYVECYICTVGDLTKAKISPCEYGLWSPSRQ
jgi:hypothetical protein